MIPPKRRMCLCRAVSAVGLAVAFLGPFAFAQKPSDNKATVLAANASFYVALNAMLKGEIGPIEAVWSHASDITYMGPTGKFEIGWNAVLKDWKGQAAQKLGGRVNPVDIHMFTGKDLAVVADVEQGEIPDADGKPQPLKLRATNIFRKEDGQWKMIGHHTDTLPYLAK